MRIKNIVKNIAVMAGIFVLAACADKLTNGNFQKIKAGMSETDVKAILGNPTKAESGEALGLRGAHYVYEKGKTKVEIVFVNGAVFTKNGNFE